MPDLAAAGRTFLETLACQVLAVGLGLLLAVAFGIMLGAACRLCGRKGK